MNESASQPDSAPPALSSGTDTFLVGVGASAGGLEAISELIKQLPARIDMALIVVQHLAPEHESLLVDLLRKITPLPVSWVNHGKSVEPGHIYLAPARHVVTIRNGVTLLEDNGKKAGGAIDHLFCSLAGEMRERAVGVILSGSSNDGVAGLRAIRAAGGITFAQSESTASFPFMPRAAIDAGCVDRVMPPDAIGEEIVRLTRTAAVLWKRTAPADEAPPQGSEAEDLATIFRVLAARTGVDFSDYKETTIKRRLVRRMAMAKIPDLRDYVGHLLKNREEVSVLFENLLINVTEFFRDTDSFEYLRQHVIPNIVDQHRDGTSIRIWVPGCSTGEEAYSLGILLREWLEEHNQSLPVQIFGTDVSERAIALARAGLYSAADVTNVSPERLQRFFTKTERGYVIQKTVRDMCVFARQNVVKDSPFSRLDLVSCRNLLIYLGPKLQKKLIPVFHYALNSGGYLLLGSSESVGNYVDLYRLIDRRWRIYRRKSTSRRPKFDFAFDPLPLKPPLPLEPAPAMPDEAKETLDIIREADRIVLGRLGPIGVLITEDLEILQFRGDVTPYLAPVEGRASLNLLKMAREGLAAELHGAVQECREKNARIHRAGISVMRGDVARQIDLDVTPIGSARTKERFYLVLFNEAGSGTPPADPDAKGKAGKSVYLAQIEQLRQDLQATRNYLQSTSEKHESTHQELRAANEEIQSSNEELQSTNEELETAKEELQSTNEELTTVNEELHSRQLELIQVNNDLHNLINSVHLPIIILGQDMRIRRFTPMAEKVLNVIPTDIGRPLSDININLNVPDLPALMTEVIDSLTIKELEVQDNKGRWYSMRLRPYKTADNKIEGVVITLIDIDQLKRIISELEEARDFSQAVIESAHEPMAVVNAALRITNANESFHRLFHTTRDRTEDHVLFDTIGDGRLGEFRAALEAVIGQGRRLANYEVQLDLPGAGQSRLLINARKIASATRGYPLMLLSVRLPD